jgi:hypothetical protein
MEQPTVVDRFLASVTAGSVADDIFADGAVLDATVPNWRFIVRGGPSVRDQLAEWYADPGGFTAVRRIPIEGGELVEFYLTWVEGGVDHACHQAHILKVDGDRITADTAFCGGRWPAPLITEMGEDTQRVGAA